MTISEKVVKKKLKRFGLDISKPKQTTLKALTMLIDRSVPNVVSPKDMIDYLNEKAEDIKKQWG